MDAWEMVEEMNRVREYHFTFDDVSYKVIVKYQIWAHGEWAALLYRLNEGERFNTYLAACKSTVSPIAAVMKAVKYAVKKQLVGVELG